MNTKKIFFIISILFGFFILSANLIFAESFSSQNYKIFDDSINYGVEPSQSQNFKTQNSLGEQAQGTAAGQNFSVKGGFLQRIIAPTNQKIPSQESSGGAMPLSFLASLNPDTKPPVLSDIIITPVSESAIRVTWQTDEESSAELMYGRTLNFELTVLKNPEFVKQHYFYVSNLKPETVYYFQIIATDKSGNKTKSDFFSAQTLKDNEPPANVFDLSILIRDSALFLKWKNPLDEDFDRVIILRKIGSFAQNIEDGDKVFEGKAEQYLDKNLINDTTYFYTIFAADIFNNISSGAIIKGKPRKIQKEEVKPTKEQVQIPEKIEETPTSPEIKPSPKETEEKIESPEEVFEPEYFPQISLPSFKTFEVESPNTEGKVKSSYLFQNFEFFIKTASAVINFNKILAEKMKTVKTVEMEKQNKIIPEEITTIKDSSLIISIKKEKLKKPAQSIVATLNNSAYLLGFDEKEQSYKTTIHTPSVKGQYPLEILIIYIDGSSERINSNVLVDPYGYVYSLVGGQQLRIKGAVVTLYWFNENKNAFEVWPAKEYNQANPQLTNEAGEFVFLVPAGKYYLTASKDGFRQAKTQILKITKDIVNINIELQQETSFSGFYKNFINKIFPDFLKSNLLPLLIISFGVIIFIIFLVMIRRIF